MRFKRLLPLSVLSATSAMVSCVYYDPPDPYSGRPPGPFPLRDGDQPGESMGRNFDRYGIPQRPTPPPMPDGIQDRDLSRYRQPERPPSGRNADGEARNYEQLDRGSDPEPSGSKYPAARRTSTPNQVVSPYPPYKKIDVTGFRSGQLAKDPENGKIFQVP